MQELDDLLDFRHYWGLLSDKYFTNEVSIEGIALRPRYPFQFEEGAIARELQKEVRGLAKFYDKKQLHAYGIFKSSLNVVEVDLTGCFTWSSQKSLRRIKAQFILKGLEDCIPQLSLLVGEKPRHLVFDMVITAKVEYLFRGFSLGTHFEHSKVEDKTFIVTASPDYIDAMTHSSHMQSAPSITPAGVYIAPISGHCADIEVEKHEREEDECPICFEQKPKTGHSLSDHTVCRLPSCKLHSEAICDSCVGEMMRPDPLCNFCYTCPFCRDNVYVISQWKKFVAKWVIDFRMANTILERDDSDNLLNRLRGLEFHLGQSYMHQYHFLLAMAARHLQLRNVIWEGFDATVSDGLKENA